MIMTRTDNRGALSLRPVTITSPVNCWAEGSAKIQMGQTFVLCTASVSETTPKWLNKPGMGWITAEYGMLPRSGDTRMNRERAYSGGRSQEISRLIGRSLRAAVPLDSFGERQIHIDCDVLQADGGTRTASITGGFVALAKSLEYLCERHLIPKMPLMSSIAAVSVGLLDGEVYLDLDSGEDKKCHTDMNFVMNNQGEFIEIQGTAERKAFSEAELLKMVKAARAGCRELFQHQALALHGDKLPLS